MIPYYQDDHLTLWGGDCRTVMAEMPAESVHCVVTSPPYWGLRDYGTATWEGGTVLDPFAGSGTTLLVAQALGRKGVGIDLSPDYLAQALTRNAQTPLGLVG